MRALAERVHLLLRRSSSRKLEWVLRNFHERADAAAAAFLHFNGRSSEARSNFNRKMIARAVDFGYVSWPRKIRDDVRGRDVLDVGCGTGLHAVGFLIVGARTYTGMDPKMMLDCDLSKNLRRRREERFGWTPRQMMHLLPRVQLVPGAFEHVAPRAVFDIAVLHNVTEHLADISAVFEGVWRRLRPDGRILFNHHNYYCWNGHHLAPKFVSEFDPEDREQAKYADWAHLAFDPPEGHYIRTGLNRIRMDDLRRLTERYFEITDWKETLTDEERGAGRLTPAIQHRHGQYTVGELTTQNVLCRARRRTVPES